MGRRARRACIVAVALGSMLAAGFRVEATEPARPASPAAPAARADVPEDRYALAGGCYVVRSLTTGGDVARRGASFVASPDGRGEPFRFQATDLGRYLLFGRVADFLAADDDAVTTASAPSDAADWQVDDLGAGSFALRLHALGRTLAATPEGGLRLVDSGGVDGDSGATRFTFRRASGCATFPEVELNVTGAPHRGETPAGAVSGYLDAHQHLMAFEFLGGRVHCGRPWHRFGVADALRDCPDHEVGDGSIAVLENFLRSGSPVGNHDPVGWPTFRDWPAPSSLTHEQTYYRWLERSWRGGLRLMVNLFVENAVLCELYPLKQNSCDEMDAVRLQATRIRELERYVDAQSGGPGEGWFRIVTDPFQARRVINEGKLAVVLGIEVSELFGCNLRLGEPTCTRADIDRQLDEVHALGVRQLELVNKLDNALSGVAGDSGTFGLLVNSANFYRTGRFWDMRTCDPSQPHVHDRNQEVLPGGIAEQDSLFGAVWAAYGPRGVLPLYTEHDHCNATGLGAMGAHTLRRLMAKGMLFDPDHMSVRGRREALDLVESVRYPGVVSSHSWSTVDGEARIHRLDGVVAPYAGGSAGFVDKWRTQRRLAGRRAFFGIGYGSDNNGFGNQGQPRGADVTNPVRYPFTGLGGVRIDKQVSGQRTYDVNVDGVAHYGLYPDWIEDLRRQAGDEIVHDLARGAEAYLRVWERAVGVAPAGCRPADVLRRVRPGMTVEQVLRAAGQPSSRDGSSYTYCTTTGGERRVRFDAGGRVTG